MRGARRRGAGARDLPEKDPTRHPVEFARAAHSYMSFYQMSAEGRWRIFTCPPHQLCARCETLAVKS